MDPIDRAGANAWIEVVSYEDARIAIDAPIHNIIVDIKGEPEDLISALVAALKNNDNLMALIKTAMFYAEKK